MPLGYKIIGDVYCMDIVFAFFAAGVVPLLRRGFQSVAPLSSFAFGSLVVATFVMSQGGDDSGCRYLALP